MLERTIRAIAGTMVLVSLGLGYFVCEHFFLLTAFVGLNLLQSAFSNWCFMENILNATVFKNKRNCVQAEQCPNGTKSQQNTI